MAIPKNKISSTSEIILKHFEDRTNPLEMNFITSGEVFTLTPLNIVDFFIECNLSLEYTAA